MDTHAKIKGLLDNFGTKPNLPITAKVVSIENDTCTIKLDSKLKLSDVRLKATIDDTDSFLIVPKVGSNVIVFSQTGELSGLMVLKVDKIDKIIIKQNGLEVIIDSNTGKITLKNASANVGSLINDLIDTLTTAQVLTPSGPGSISPATVTQLNGIKAKFNLILNSN